MFRVVARRLCTAAAAGSASSSGASAGRSSTAAAPAVTDPYQPSVSTSHAAEEAPKRKLTEEEKQEIRDFLIERGLEKEAALIGDDGLPPVPDHGPYSPPPAFPFRPRRNALAPEHFVSREANGHVDPLALSINAGRSDPEWQWLKFLCFFCAMSTLGTWVYGVFFPEHMKYFKDEPWSPFKH